MAGCSSLRNGKADVVDVVGDFELLDQVTSRTAVLQRCDPKLLQTMDLLKKVNIALLIRRPRLNSKFKMWADVGEVKCTPQYEAAAAESFSE